MIIFYTIYIYFLLALFGACIGSFLNVVIYRLPNGNFLSEARSYCPDCKERLKWYDLLPIVSYAMLRGRCRYCKKRISLRYPLVETAGALLAVLCYMRFGFTIGTVLSFGVSAILLAIALIDLDTMEIPDSLLLALLAFAACALFGWPAISLAERTIGFFVISVPLLLITLVIPGAFGGGDIKLMAVCGFLLGWKNTLLAFFVALLIGGGYAVYLLVSGKSKRGAHIAFGPYLCIGVAVALFWGTEIVRFYLNLFMY